MAIKGLWLAQQNGTDPYGSALKQGTGVNPIHGIRDGGMGRNIAPGTTAGTVPTGDFSDGFAPDYSCGYMPEDSESALWGYGVETGTADRPGVGMPDDRNNTASWPVWGPYQNGQPGGTHLRTLEHGAVANITGKQIQERDAAAGFQAKDTSYVEDATTSDPSQYEMQTSMTQRDKVRSGSQIAGTASDQDAPIASRITPMRLPKYSGEYRHEDMLPKSQDNILRPFWLRTAGTGYREWMQANEVTGTTPMQRTPPPDPYQGSDTGAGYGFTSEDAIPYV